MSIPQSFLHELLARTDIVEVVGRYVQLKKGGANFMGLCPFHGEKSPSFSVSPAKQFYHCFGCGVNGNAISFLMEHNGMGFVEAVKDLAQQIGMPVPDDRAEPVNREQERQSREQRTTLTDLLSSVAKAYQRQLKVSQRAVAYLKGRGLTGEIAQRFGLGYAPAGWRTLASLVPDYADPHLVEAGLVISKQADDAAHSTDPERKPGTTSPTEEANEKRYDRFRDRIMFPIRNVKGEFIGFGGRVLDQGEPKYLNSPETPVFSKGHELYGLYEARADIRTQGYALVTEGYMDVVALAQHGFGQAVATLGTACTPEHVQKLFRFTESVIFSFDGDAAGRRAAAKAMVAALPHAQDTRSIRFLFLPTEHDPDSFIREQGHDAFATCVRNAMPLSAYLMEVAADGCELQTVEGRARMAAKARPLWSALPEGALKRQLLGELAQRIQLQAHDLLDLWSSGRTGVGGVAASEPPEREHFSDSYNPNQNKRKPYFSRQNESSDGRRYTKRSGYGNSSESGWRPSQPAPRIQHTRMAQVTRILLTQPNAWSAITAEDLDLLSQAQDPYGPLLTWLEHQWHEHGPQPWAVIQQALAEQPFASFTNQLVNGARVLERTDAEQAYADALAEMRDALIRIHIDHLSNLASQAAAEAAHNPDAIRQWQEWDARRKALLKELQTPPTL